MRASVCVCVKESKKSEGNLGIRKKSKILMIESKKLDIIVEKCVRGHRWVSICMRVKECIHSYTPRKDKSTIADSCYSLLFLSTYRRGSGSRVLILCK